MKTIILLPTYNEKENIGQIVPDIFAAVPETHILVIDDNSPDGTAEVVKEMQSKFSNLHLLNREKKEGLGKAYVDGYKKVFADLGDVEVICMMDADFSHHPKYLPGIFAKMKEYDFVIGSRYNKEGAIEGWEKKREWLSKLGNLYVRSITRMPIMDATSGFECMRVEKLKQIEFSQFDPSGYAFQIYLKYKMWKMGTKIYEYPICFFSRRNGESKISWKIVLEGLLIPWRLK